MKIPKDKIKHFTVCFLVAFTASAAESWCGASYLHSAMAGFIAGEAIGVGKEYGDKCAPGNRWDWQDILADTAGAAFGCIAGSLFALFNH